MKKLKDLRNLLEDQVLSEDAEGMLTRLRDEFGEGKKREKFT